MDLIFEKSKIGRKNNILPKCDTPTYDLDSNLKRNTAPRLPEIAEIDITRHYSMLADNVFGVNNGFYPLGSCTMKYNPKINDELAQLSPFANIHPLQPIETVQGAIEVLCMAESLLSEVTGMDNMTFQPAAGAHGEFLGILLIKAYHESQNDTKRNTIIVPDTAHGTNPATATMCGYKVVNLKSNEKGCIDLEELKKVVGDNTAGLMLTNPNTIGVFDENILEITKIIHDAGGLCYYDGANMNAISGICRPGDMGFDVIHLNLHKSFSTPHGGGGPGSGAVGCKKILSPFLPKDMHIKKGDKFDFYDPEQTIGRVKNFYGNFGITLRALTYVISLGADGLKESSENAVLNANYLKDKLKDLYPVPYDGICMHEFVASIEKLKKETGVTALDISKTILDYKMHPPTMYFPLLVNEALMFEPTETESRETLDKAIAVYREIYEKALTNPEDLKNTPVTTIIGRPDEVNAARNPKVKYSF